MTSQDRRRQDKIEMMLCDAYLCEPPMSSPILGTRMSMAATVSLSSLSFM
jgi:hypothetical protein